MRIGIIGGTGSFGRHLGGLFESFSHDIVISGSSLGKAERIAGDLGWEAGSNVFVARSVDVLVFSVPISITEDVIMEVCDVVPSDTLVCDVTSVKSMPCELMSECSDEVLGMHPMYGPSNSPEGQRVVLCPIKGDRWEFLRDFWEGVGADVFVTDPETHDRAMSVVQGLIHFSELVVAETIRRSGLDPEELENFSSPVYQLVKDLTGRMLNQKSELYRSIQVMNPKNEEIRKEFLCSARDVMSILDDSEAFGKKFEELGEFFDKERAQDRTDEVIDFLSDVLASEDN